MIWIIAINVYAGVVYVVYAYVTIEYLAEPEPRDPPSFFLGYLTLSVFIIAGIGVGNEIRVFINQLDPTIETVRLFLSNQNNGSDEKDIED